jgi:hypothetical protein
VHERLPFDLGIAKPLLEEGERPYRIGDEKGTLECQSSFVLGNKRREAALEMLGRLNLTQGGRGCGAYSSTWRLCHLWRALELYFGQRRNKAESSGCSLMRRHRIIPRLKEKKVGRVSRLYDLTVRSRL